MFFVPGQDLDIYSLKQMPLKKTLTAALLMGMMLFFAEVLFAARGSVPLQIIGFIKGPVKGDFLGASVAPAGDINQDGYPDFLAAAGYRGGTTLGGLRVYLYHGGPEIATGVPALTFPYAARTLVNLSDINGDSLPDYAFWPGDSSPVRVYFGGTPPDTFPDLVFRLEAVGDMSSALFGTEIASGDVDSGDGRDLLITNPGYPDIIGSNGKIYLYLNNGLAGLDTSADWTVTGAGRSQQRAALGVGSIIVSDLNGDGFADIVVGERGIGGGGGCIHIFLGRKNLNTAPDVTIHSSDPLFGSPLSAVVDLNGDGYQDFAVTRPSGFPMIYFGGPTIDTVPGLTLDKVAEVLAPAGDINHDGYPDLLTGHPLGTNFQTGFAYVYFGGPNMDNKADVIIDEADLPVPAPNFGQALAGVGDVNGDGVDDFIVGAQEGIAPTDDRGQVWVFAGDSMLVSTDVEEIPTNRPIANSWLMQNYPNPFNPQTSIEYDLKSAQPVHTRLEIFDLLGRLVTVLVDEVQMTGRYRTTWDGKDAAGHTVASGLYIYRLKAGNYTKTKKLMLVK